jgi:hypothetical protein
VEKNTAAILLGVCETLLTDKKSKAELARLIKKKMIEMENDDGTINVPQ